jgi:hypothetical protein
MTSYSSRLPEKKIHALKVAKIGAMRGLLRFLHVLVQRLIVHARFKKKKKKKVVNFQASTFAPFSSRNSGDVRASANEITVQHSIAHLQAKSDVLHCPKPTCKYSSSKLLWSRNSAANLFTFSNFMASYKSVTFILSF